MAVVGHALTGQRNGSGGEAPAETRDSCPQRGEVEAELSRLLASDKISRNANTSRFLRYVVEETLAGRGERLKAFSIATQALGRSDSFDPQSDSIVRVQAVRVRAQLDEYYVGPGAANPVRITLPKGAYQPKFEYLSVEAAPASPTAHIALAPAVAASPPRARSQLWRIAVGATLALLAAIGAAVLILAPIGHGRPAWPEGAPVLAIESRGAPKAGPLAAAAETMLTGIEIAAAAGEYVRVRRIPEGQADMDADYVLEARFSDASANAFDVAFVLTERRNREVTWSRMLKGVAADDRARQEQLAHSIAAAMGDVGGVLLADVSRRLEAEGAPLAGLRCRLKALNYLLRFDADRAAAGRCLEEQIGREPNDIRSLTLLSTFLVVGYLEGLPGDKGDIDVQRALQLARRAYDLNPSSPNTLAALFYARFADHRFDDAFAFAARIQDKAPNPLSVRLRMGAAFVARGRYPEGIAELEGVEAQLGAPQAVATAFLALAALMRDDFAALDRYDSRAVATSTPMGLLLGMIACRRRGDLEGMKSRREMLQTNFPNFAADYPAAFSRYGLESSIAKRLQTELAAVGAANQE